MRVTEPCRSRRRAAAATRRTQDVDERAGRLSDPGDTLPVVLGCRGPNSTLGQTAAQRSRARCTPRQPDISAARPTELTACRRRTEFGRCPAYHSAVRRYYVTTFGCQMNAHDSERIKGMLEELGLGEATSQDDADVLVFNTCTIREKPDTKLAAHLGQAAALKRARPRAGDRRRRLLRRGAARAASSSSTRSSTSPSGPARSRTSATGSAPAETASRAGASARDERTSPASCRCTASGRFQAWVQVSMGCNSKCAYCIVPAVRGREVSRRPGRDPRRGDAPRRAKASARSRCSDRTSTRTAATCARHPHRLRRAAARLRRGRRDRADPLHEPAPEGLPPSR